MAEAYRATAASIRKPWHASSSASQQTMEELARRTVAAAGGTLGGFAVFALGLLGTLVTAFFLYGIIVPLTNGALTIAVADRILGGNAGWRAVWMLLFRRLRQAPRDAVIPAALLGARLRLLRDSGVVLGLFFAFASPVVLVEGLSGRAALRRSTDLVPLRLGSRRSGAGRIRRGPLVSPMLANVLIRARRSSSARCSAISSRWCSCPCLCWAPCCSTSTSVASATTSLRILLAPTSPRSRARPPELRNLRDQLTRPRETELLGTDRTLPGFA